MTIWTASIAIGCIGIPSGILLADDQAGGKDDPQKAEAAENTEIQAEVKAPPAPRGVDALDQDALQRAFRILRERYLDKGTLTDLEVNRAALQGLLDRQNMGAQLVIDDDPAEKPAFQFVAEWLDESIAYIRLASYSLEEVKDLEEAIVSFRRDGKASPHLILDLRVPAPHRDVALAVKFLSCFVREGNELFRIIKPGEKKTRPLIFMTTQTTRWTQPLTILVDEESGNIAELIAAGLAKFRPEVTSIGAPTPGRAAEYRKLPISKNASIRIAVASIELSDGSSLFRQGFDPKIRLAFPAPEKHARFRETAKGGVAKVAFDELRPQLNEAALVDGSNPEISYDILKSKGSISPFDLIQPKDRVIQRAVDLIVSRRFFRDTLSKPEQQDEKKAPAEDPEGPDDENAEKKAAGAEPTPGEEKKKKDPKRLAPLPE